MRDSITARRCDRRSPQSKERHDSQQTHHLPGQRSGDTAHRSRSSRPAVAVAPPPRRHRRRRRRPRPRPLRLRLFGLRTAAWGGSWSTPPAARCTCSRPTRPPAARARARARSRGRRCCERAPLPMSPAARTALSLDTIPRSDGARQVTYNGHPLYTFVKDHKPGDVNGQGLTAFGAAWFAVSAAGNQISSTAGHGSGRRRRRSPPRPRSPTGSEAAPAGSEPLRRAACEAGSASQQRHPPKQRW